MGLGKALKELRNKRGWTLTETAKALKVSLTTYREWEEGRKLPADKLVSLAALHSISVSELLGQRQLSNEELARALSCFETGIAHLRKAISNL